jgi:DNA-binding transcriptional LysR family regulator
MDIGFHGYHLFMPQIRRQRASLGGDRAGLEIFDLNLLRVLDALLAARSVSGAARQLDLSQPATSAALSRLRAALRDPVLVRNGNRMVATPLAEELRPRITRILGDIGDALSAAAAFDPVTTERHFRIGANDYAALVLLAPLAQRLRRLAPRATLEILPYDNEPESGLITREMDLVVADRWTLRGMRDLETLFRESFVSIARADHPRLSRHPTLQEFLDEDHALISSHGVTPGVVDAALGALGRARRVALTVPHYLVAPMIVARTDLIMTLPRRIADSLPHAHGLRKFRPPVRLEGFDVAMAFHPRSNAEAPIQWLKQVLRALVVDMGKPGRHR